jgi:hypothetical protein
MHTEEEIKFIRYWAANREKQSTLKYRLMFGLPLGLLVSLPILVNFLMGRFWYRRADAVGASQFNPIVLVAAVMIIAVFVAFFYKQFQWERNENRYLELTRKKN